MIHCFQIMINTQVTEIVTTGHYGFLMEISKTKLQTILLIKKDIKTI